MIDEVLGSYIDSLEEREFDAPFIALLRALGFTDIHFLHGSFEFGKDFIAKSTSCSIAQQFAFQTKAGDIDLASWNRCRGQLDLLRTNSLAHPNFDRNLPRNAVFVTTGRLVGGAGLAAQDYAEYLKSGGETTLTVWDRESIIERMGKSPESALSGSSAGLLLSIIGRAELGQLRDADVEEFSRNWICATSDISICRKAIEASVLANRLRCSGRLDLACYTSLCLTRAAWATSHNTEPPDGFALAVADTAASMFLHYASDLSTSCANSALMATEFLSDGGPAALVTYPVRCARVAELLGLLGLLKLQAGSSDWKATADFIDQFTKANPGCRHPISDHWAVSLIPPVLLLCVDNRITSAHSLLEDVTRWIGNRYDGNTLGLASPRANPAEELEYFLGSPFEHVKGNRRTESYVSTVVLDLAAIAGMGDLYEIARNDFTAVGAISPVIEVPDSAGQYVLGAVDLTYEPNVPYEPHWTPSEERRVAPHHGRGPASYYLQRIGRDWDHLATSAVLRDRHFISTCRSILARSQLMSA